MPALKALEEYDISCMGCHCLIAARAQLGTSAADVLSIFRSTLKRRVPKTKDDQPLLEASRDNGVMSTSLRMAQGKCRARNKR